MADLFAAGNAYQPNYGVPQSYSPSLSSPGTFGVYSGIPSRPTSSLSTDYSQQIAIPSYGAAFPGTVAPAAQQSAPQTYTPYSLSAAQTNLSSAIGSNAPATPASISPFTPISPSVSLPTVGPATKPDPTNPAVQVKTRVRAIGSAPVSSPENIPMRWLPIFHGAGYGFTVKGGSGAIYTPGGWFRGNVSEGFSQGTPTTY